MATQALAGSMSLYNDELFTTTDLNRRAGEVLNHARKSPVTISRNGEQFALLKREQAAGLVKAANQFGPTLELVESVINIVEGKEPASSLLWLKAYGPEDLRKMLREIVVASVAALQETGDWEPVNAVIHEWHESAIVHLSGIFDEAMASSEEEVLLPEPHSVVQAEEAEACLAAK